ncbi:MAG: TetR/AcrR family transcriptional regulator [Actinomycetia bacterium]|nr:TetR/AcrR family transcriptional regulator [Actinomycetes bacterium]MCH9710389.1 TetR/AcrR family transcriptional regulator [Actinomycetes bacterium]MCH9766218.1 TetR/AcrR family transcriptional regulator [Actinomycetes bacterium]
MTNTGDGERVDGRRLRYQNRRGEILDAVIAHVLDHGIGTMSFRTLAAAVGVSHVTLHHHFGTKDELLVEIFDEIGKRQPIPDQLSNDDIEVLVRQLWHLWTQPEGARQFRLLFEAYGQALRNPEEHRALLNNIVTRWIEVIRRLALQAGCPRCDADDFATVLVAQLRGLQLDLLATDDHDRVNSALDNVIDDIRDQRTRWNNPKT